ASARGDVRGGGVPIVPGAHRRVCPQVGQPLSEPCRDGTHRAVRRRGRRRRPLAKDAYDSPYAIESTHLRFLDTDLGAEVTRHLWAVAREYRESFDVYGAVRSFEWEQTESAGHVMYLG